MPFNQGLPPLRLRNPTEEVSSAESVKKQDSSNQKDASKAIF